MMTLDIYQQRRQNLLEALPENGMALIASGDEKIRNRDVEYAFRASSDFYYLTGFDEPEAVLVLMKGKGQKSHLFLRPKDIEQETWQGRRLGVDAAAAALGIDHAWSIADFENTLNELVEGVSQLYFSFAELAHWAPLAESWINVQKAKARKGVEAPHALCDLDAILHEMRLIKSPDEIQIMREAAQISVKGHLAAMRAVAHGKMEYQVQAEMECCFKQLGSSRVAFNSIVASGENACVLHYTENQSQMARGDLVLVDAGAECNGYAGDITHTYPIDGRFSTAQAELYTLVLNAQAAAISKVKPGNRYDEMHQAAVRTLVEGLCALKLLLGDVETLIESEAYKTYFMHGTGHWLGMDVHDVGAYKKEGEWRCFEPGMVVTVEPGLYIPMSSKTAPEVYRGIGIRIEDDVLVTEEGSEVLSVGLPRTVADIEAWMSSR